MPVTPVTCQASIFDETAPANLNCVLYDNYSNTETNEAATTTYNGFDCAAIQAGFGSTSPLPLCAGCG
jgi:hypothetical protein